MPKKKQQTSLTRTIVKYILVIPAVLGLLENIVLLAKSEVQTTKKNIVTLFIVGIFALTLLGSIWLCCTALMVIFFLHLQLSIAASILFAIIVNLVFFLICCLILSLTKVDLLLPETRKLIKDLIAG